MRIEDGSAHRGNALLAFADRVRPPAPSCRGQLTEEPVQHVRLQIGSDVGDVGGVRPGQEHLAGRPAGQGQRGTDVHDGSEFARRFHGIHAQADVSVAHVELRALAGRPRESLEGRVGQIAQRQVPRGAVGEAEQPGSQGVAVPSHVHQESMGFQRSDHAVSRGPGEAGGADHVGEAACPAFDGIQHVERAIEGADARFAAGSSAGRRRREPPAILPRTCSK